MAFKDMPGLPTGFGAVLDTNVKHIDDFPVSPEIQLGTILSGST
jgi:hypothetical protein